jgi:hypothetical protein
MMLLQGLWNLVPIAKVAIVLMLFYWFVGLGPSGSGMLVLLSIGCYFNPAMKMCMCCTVVAAVESARLLVMVR